MKNNIEKTIRLKIKRRLLLFIVLLCLSGITAFPLLTEITLLHNLPWYFSTPAIHKWIDKVYTGIKSTETSYPFMAYGTDWLALCSVLPCSLSFIVIYKSWKIIHLISILKIKIKHYET